MGSSAARPDREALTQPVVRAAFLARLVCLLLALLLAGGAPVPLRAVAAVVLLTATSAAGLLLGDRAAAVLRRHPVLVALDVLAVTAATALVGVGNGLVFLGLTSALLIGLLLRGRDAVLLGAVLVLGFAAAVAVTPPQDLVAAVAVVPLADGALVWLGATVARLHERALAEQRAGAAARAAVAATAERARLARSVHDSIAGSLHGIALAATGLQTWVQRDPAEAGRRAAALAEAAEQASAQARRLLVELRSEEDDRPLLPLVRARAEAFTARTGTPVELDLHGVADVDDAARTDLLAVLEEALCNVERHAGAGRVVVELRGGPQGLSLLVQDDGCGLPADRPDAARAQGRYGLVGMRERAALLGGTLEVGAAADADGGATGTRVRLTVPHRVQVPA